MPESFQIDIPRDATRIWELDVPVLVNAEEKRLEAYLTDSIGPPALYNELCHHLKEADAEWDVVLHINTGGGILDSAFMIRDAITKSKAAVVAHLTGTVASAGTIIALSCDELEVSDHLSFMIHNYSGGMQGKGHEMKARQKFSDDQLEAAFIDVYAGFLSDDERERVIEGTDLWMGEDEVEERWSNRRHYLNTDMEGNEYGES